MTSNELRQKFIQFFQTKDHLLVPSASLVPQNDPSVLFNTAGMQQFKNFYTNPNDAPAKNVVTCQKCFRTSDIEEVGDATHLTFFEMLGNFSFGGYFKKEAISWGYEFLTKEMQIAPERIWCSVFKGDDTNPRDNESAQIFESMGLKYQEHNREDNFWGPTGEQGPCGPTVEFYVDDIEVWNLVFNEYFKNDDGSYRDLETKGIDTGMGLERMLVLINNQNDVYQSDLLQPIVKKIEDLSQKIYGDFQTEIRIIADHVKAGVFAIGDDVMPTNKDRGYIVRRIIRRAVVKASQIGINQNFIKNLAEEVYKIYDEVYQFDQEKISSELEKEETKFRNTLSAGLKILSSREQIDGKILFDLFQSYGLPLEISLEEAKNSKIKISSEAIEQFNNALKSHQDLSRTASAGMFKGGLAGTGEMETKFHTATHLLLASLRKVLGPDINQKGANINSERIRFDFNYPEKLTDEQIKKVEDDVNKNISDNLSVSLEEMSYEDAKNCGATGIFDKKYGANVKVYTIAEISKEICGGPHVKSTGELGHFKIIKEESSSAGIRRIRAILE